MIEILDIVNSKKPDKRFRITLQLEDGSVKSWDFGAKNGSTYIDHADKIKRENYLKRHRANPIERERIDNVVPSNALFSAVLLWGKNSDLTDNIIHLQKLFSKK